MAVAMLATPVLAIGPQNAEGKNPNLVVYYSGMITEVWLPSGMMNEWLNQEGFPPGRVTILDAAKAHIVNAPEAITPFDAMDAENKWFHLSEGQFAELLGAFGLVSPNDYPEGVYMKLVYVAFKP
jgi:hypothetical protein